MPKAAAYTASKAGLIALTKTPGKELAAAGIFVNAVTPSMVVTAMSRDLSAERAAEILARIPMHRFGTAEEIAAHLAWLCSDDCSFATGATFGLSGGRAPYRRYSTVLSAKLARRSPAASACCRARQLHGGTSGHQSGTGA